MRRIRILLLVVAGVAAGILAGVACSGATSESPTPPQAPASAAESPSRGGISVSGTGSISLTPDIATLVLGVEALDETVAQARSDAAEAMAGIVDVLKEAIDDKDIQTQRLSIQPQYDYSSETRQLIGFSVSNIVNVTIRDIDSVGTVIDEAVGAGGDLTRVQSIGFSVDDTSSYEKQLVEEAVEDATDKAQHLADLTGVSLGKPLSISYGGGVPYPVFDNFARLEMAESAAFDTSISPGEVETSVIVNILFAIE